MAGDTEDIPDQSLWTIALGDANVAMLAPLFEGMFRETTDLDSLALAAGNTALDGVIEPQLAFGGDRHGEPGSSKVSLHSRNQAAYRGDLPAVGVRGIPVTAVAGSALAGS